MNRPVIAVDLGDRTVAASADVPPADSSAPAGPGSAGAGTPPAHPLDPVDLATDLAAVFAPADGDALVTGTAARRRAAADPGRYEPTPRRRADDGELLLGTRVVGLAEAWGAVVSGAVTRGGSLLRGGRPHLLVLTHPVAWDAGRVDLLRRAGSGLADDLLLVTEPVAAASLAAWMRPGAGHPGSGPVIGVLDVGATAATAAVVEPARGRVLAHRADDRFGGDDADEMLLAHLLADPSTGGRDRVREVAAGATLGDRRHRAVLVDDVRAAKERLSDVEQAEVPMPGGGTAAWLARGEVEEVLAGAWRGVVALLADAVAAAGTTPDRLDAVWLTGGAARTPQLATLVHRELGVPATVASDPGLVVARGALVVARTAASDAGSSRAGSSAAGSSRAGSAVPEPAVAVGAPPAGPSEPAPGPGTWSSRSREGSWGEPWAVTPQSHPPGPAEPDPAAETVRLGSANGAAAPGARFAVSEAGGAGGGRGSSATGDPTGDRGGSGGGGSGRGDDGGGGDGGESSWPDLPAGPRRRRHRGRWIGVAAVVAVLAALGVGAVVHFRPDHAPSGTPITSYAHRVIVPVGWFRAQNDDASRRTLLRPADAPRGPDLIAVQDSPADGVDPADVRAQLQTQFDAARAAGTPVGDLQLDTTLGDRPVARYHQDSSPGVRVDWIVLLTPGSQVSVGCRHAVDDAATGRLLAICTQVVSSVGPLGG